MAVIRCKACGRLYNYREEGLCPGCGAYNRPPKRERVNADGTVQHMTDAAYEKRRRAQEKVCFERKECHEDQARRGRQRAAEISAAPIARTGGKGRKSPVRSIILTVIAIVILYRLVGSLSGMFSRRAELSDESTFPYIDPVEIDPGDEDPVVSEFDAAMGDEVIMSDGIAFIVREWERSDEDEALVVILEPIFDEDSDSYYTDHYYTASWSVSPGTAARRARRRSSPSPAMPPSSSPCSRAGATTS